MLWGDGNSCNRDEVVEISFWTPCRQMDFSLSSLRVTHAVCGWLLCRVDKSEICLGRARETQSSLIVGQDLSKISDAISLPNDGSPCLMTSWRSLTHVVGAYVSGGCTESPPDRMPFLINCGNRRDGLKKFRRNSMRFSPKGIPTPE